MRAMFCILVLAAASGKQMKLHEKRHRDYSKKMDRLIDHAIVSGEYSADDLEALREEVASHVTRRQDLHLLRHNLESNRDGDNDAGEKAERLLEIDSQLAALDAEHNVFFHRHKWQVNKGDITFSAHPEQMHAVEEERTPEEHRQKRREGDALRSQKSRCRVDLLHERARKSGKFDSAALRALRDELEEWVSDEGKLWHDDSRPIRESRVEPTEEHMAHVHSHEKAVRAHHRKHREIEKRIHREL